MYGKFPYCVIKSDYFHYKGEENVTLSHLQEDLVKSLNLCADRANGLNATLHVCAGKGDWKRRKEWLQQTRFYGKVTHGSHGICPRCFAAKNDWLDVHERFNNDADVLRAQATAVGENIALKQLSGWTCNMELPDLLHCIWLGTGRDLTGSLCMEMAEKRQDLVGSWTCNMELPDLLHCIWLGTGRDLTGSLCMEMAEKRQDLVCSCFKEEDYVGQLCRVAKLAVSSVTLSKRILQRWLLQYNAMIVQTR
eukprot:s2757_g1.t1